jgi:hypothetical protein
MLSLSQIEVKIHEALRLVRSTIDTLDDINSASSLICDETVVFKMPILHEEFCRTITPFLDEQSGYDYAHSDSCVTVKKS